MEKIFAGTSPPTSLSSPFSGIIKLEAARAEHQPFQVAVRPEVTMRNVTVSVNLNTPGGGGNISFEVRRVARVPVAVPTNTRNLTGEFPDPLPLPCSAGGGGEMLPGGSTSAFWITAIVPASAVSGKQRGHVELRTGGTVFARLSIEIVVWSFSVSKLTQVTDSGFNGLDPASWRAGQRKSYPGLTEAEVLDAWTSGLTSHRVNWMAYTQLLPQIGIAVTEGGNQQRQHVTVNLNSTLFAQPVFAQIHIMDHCPPN
eukprot:COSAG05_NODE_6129_length_1017_cov_1.403050_1_plen_255_part_01